MSTLTTNRPAGKRVPIPMSADEIDALQQLAKADSRKLASMARIIYLEGLKQYELHAKQRRK
jgi:hypothetical protein